MQTKPSIHELAKKAQEVFHRNIDTLVAGFLIRHPDIDPGDIILVSQATSDGFRIYVDAKELHVPPEKSDPEYVAFETDPAAHDAEQKYVDGWNACRQAIIDMGVAARGKAGDSAHIGGLDG